MKKSNKHVIWSDMDLNLDDWIDDLREYYPDENDYYSLMEEINREYLEDEKSNLKSIHTDGRIIEIGSCKRWDGIHRGYGYDNESSVSMCLQYGGDVLAEFYVDDRNDFRARFVDHDGDSVFLFRELRPELSEQQIENFESKLCVGTATRRDINRYTRKLGDRIAQVYGW